MAGGGAGWEVFDRCWYFSFYSSCLLGWLLLLRIGVAVVVVSVGRFQGCWCARVEGGVDQVHYANHHLP